MAIVSPDLNVMIRAAEKAARSLVRDYGEVENLQVSRKGPADFVSAADRRSEKIIYEELSKTRPKFSFLMEESGKIEGEDKDNVFIVDPLDGTTNFLHGIPHWAISIALQRNGETVAGVVYDPIKDEMFHAEKGAGAFVHRNRRLRVSGRSDPMQCVVLFGGQIKPDPKRNKRFVTEIANIITRFPNIRRYGAAALDLAYVAAGRSEAFWERELNPWDVAAGILILKESGGFVSDLAGEDPVFGKALLATNEHIHGELKKILNNNEEKS